MNTCPRKTQIRLNVNKLIALPMKLGMFEMKKGEHFLYVYCLHMLIRSSSFREIKHSKIQSFTEATRYMKYSHIRLETFQFFFSSLRIGYIELSLHFCYSAEIETVDLNNSFRLAHLSILVSMRDSQFTENLFVALMFNIDYHRQKGNSFGINTVHFA